MNTYLLAFFVSLMVMLAICRRAAAVATRLGIVDHPNDERKRHRGAIPRVGGPTLLLAVVAGLVAAALVPTSTGAALVADGGKLLALVVLSLVAMLIGLLDDLTTLRPWQKLALQILLAAGAWAAGFRVLERWSPEGEITALGVLSLPVTIVWIVGITNAFNLIDGADGLAAGAALFSTSALLIASLVQQQPATTIVLAALAGATLGFLRFNFFPASVFLGDSGSLLLGFALSLIAIDGAHKSSTAFAVAVPVVALGLPVLDTMMSVLRRAIAGVHIFQADRHHVHHMLMDRGLSPRDAVVILYAVSGLFGLFSLLFLHPSGKRAGLTLVVLGACVWFGIRQLRYPEMAGLWDHVSNGGTRRALASSVIVRRLVEDLTRACTAADVRYCLERALSALGVEHADLYLTDTEARDELLGAGAGAGVLRVSARGLGPSLSRSSDARVVVSIPIRSRDNLQEGALTLAYGRGQWVVGLPPLDPDVGEALSSALARLREARAAAALPFEPVERPSAVSA